MSQVTDVILSYGGTVALPLFVWCLIAAALFFCSVFAGVTRLWCLITCRRCRVVLAGLLLLVWMVHSAVLVYTCCQIYRIGWATNWYPGSVPSADMIYDVAVVCLIMALIAGNFLLCASFIATWDLHKRPA